MSSAKKLIDALKAEIKPAMNPFFASYIQLVEFFPLRSITNHEEHRAALVLIEKLITYIQAGDVNDEGLNVYLATLSDLVADYESGIYKTSKVSGHEMLAYLMELQGLTQKDLAKEVGGQSIVSKILAGKRELNIRQIKALAKRFKISPVVFFY